MFLRNIKIFKIILKYIYFSYVFLIIECGSSFAKEIKKLNYDIQLSNIQVGKTLVTFEKKKNKFTFHVSSISKGFIDVFYNYKSHITASLYSKKNKWLPHKYLIISDFNNKKTYSEVLWDHLNEDIKFKLDPPLNLEKVHKIEKKSLENVIDPISALVRLQNQLNINKSCNNMFKIFDGRRRYNIILKDLGIFFLEKDRPKSYTGKTIVCGMKFIPIGGHRLKSKWRPKEDKFGDIKVYFSNIVQNKMIPVRVKITRWFGTIIVRLLKDNI